MFSTYKVGQESSSQEWFVIKNFSHSYCTYLPLSTAIGFFPSYLRAFILHNGDYSLKQNRNDGEYVFGLCLWFLAHIQKFMDCP